MKIQKLLICLTLPLATVLISPKMIAQNPPASTYQPGFWQPVARFDVKRPVSVMIVNKTGLTLEYDVTDLEFIDPQQVTPGKSGVINNFGDAANIVIYPLNASDTSEPFTLRFDITVNEDNSVMVSVLKEKAEFFGHRALNLQKTGAIFIY